MQIAQTLERRLCALPYSLISVMLLSVRHVVRPALAVASFFTGALGLLVVPAHAHVQVSAGLNVNKPPFMSGRREHRTAVAETGLEVGAMAIVARAHSTREPALLLAQKWCKRPFVSTMSSKKTGQRSTTKFIYRFRYAALPLNLAYYQRADGHGVRLPAGFRLVLPRGAQDAPAVPAPEQEHLQLT